MLNASFKADELKVCAFLLVTIHLLYLSLIILEAGPKTAAPVFKGDSERIIPCLTLHYPEGFEKVLVTTKKKLSPAPKKRVASLASLAGFSNAGMIPSGAPWQ
jgi:hypothetical protein